ncbi:TPA: hypothetical protein GXX44_08335 [bacterium]|jgi:ribonuclease HIII|nr:hypothetical protein [bacterium]
MNKIKSYSWRDIEIDLGKKIEGLLLERGWRKEIARSSKELWRIKSEGFTCIFYTTGTLFFSYCIDKEDEFKELKEVIDQIAGSRYVLPDKDILIGVDEVGKGEVIGSIVLVGVAFPRSIFCRLDIALDNVDTKHSHNIEYWEDIYKNIEKFKDEGLLFAEDKILPSEIDKSINLIMDERYRRILERLLSNIDVGLDDCRIIIDDYRIGKVLEQFLHKLEDNGAEVIAVSRSEDRYLETRVASVIAKWIRSEELREIGILGTGNTGDKRILEWLGEWYSSYKSWPWFVKRTFRTIREIENSINIKGR